MKSPPPQWAHNSSQCTNKWNPYMDPWSFSIWSTIFFKNQFLYSTLHHTEKPAIEICQKKIKNIFFFFFLSLIFKGSSKHFQNPFNLDIFQFFNFFPLIFGEIPELKRMLDCRALGW